MCVLARTLTSWPSGPSQSSGCRVGLHHASPQRFTPCGRGIRTGKKKQLEVGPQDRQKTFPSTLPTQETSPRAIEQRGEEESSGCPVENKGIVQ